jgi:hypothetical protein
VAPVGAGAKKRESASFICKQNIYVLVKAKSLSALFGIAYMKKEIHRGGKSRVGRG